MAQYITIQEAAVFSKKSLQTIRRLIKTNRIKYRRQETPQGFTYLVEHNSLKNFLAAPMRAPYGAKYQTRKKTAEKIVLEDTEEILDSPPVQQISHQPKPALPQILEVETIITKTEKEPDVGVYSIGKTVGASPVEETVDAPVDMATPQETNEEQSTALAPTTEKNPQEEMVVEQLLATIRDLQAQHAQDKNKLYELLENFQRRAVILEERVKQLEAPRQKRRWWQRFF